MIKYVLVFATGFIAHKAINYVYDISFEKGFSSKACRNQYLADQHNFECTYKQMGIVANLKWILIRPSGLAGEKWTF